VGSRFENEVKEENYEEIRNKMFVHEKWIDFDSLVDYPAIRYTDAYGWPTFISMIGSSNLTWAYELYANALRYADEEYVSYVHGNRISYIPDDLDTLFGFHPEQ
jgi:hypothetical protein